MKKNLKFSHYELFYFIDNHTFPNKIWSGQLPHDLYSLLGTVRFTSMNPRLFEESILFIFSGSTWAKDKPNTNFHILIPRAFKWACQIFNPTNATADIRQNMILSYLFDQLENIFAVEKCMDSF